MTTDKAALILNTVLVRSKQGTIPWITTSTDDAFEAPYAELTLRIVREEGYDDEAGGEKYTLYFLELVNENGRVADTIRPFQVYKIVPNAWELTGDIFELARDKALGVSQIADKLLEELGGPVPLQPSPEAP